MAPIRPVAKTTTILNTATTSAAVMLDDTTLLAVQTPAAFTGVAITFTCSDTVAGTYVPVHIAAGTAYTITVAAARFTVVDPNVFIGVKWLKVVSGSAEGADRTVTLWTRPINS